MDEQTGALFSHVRPEALVPKDHPLRAIRRLVNAALEQLSPTKADANADARFDAPDPMQP